MPSPTSFDTNTTGPRRARESCDERIRLADRLPAGTHEVREPEGETIDEHGCTGRQCAPRAVTRSSGTSTVAHRSPRRTRCLADPLAPSPRLWPRRSLCRCICPSGSRRAVRRSGSCPSALLRARASRAAMSGLPSSYGRAGGCEFARASGALTKEFDAHRSRLGPVNQSLPWRANRAAKRADG